GGPLAGHDNGRSEGVRGVLRADCAQPGSSASGGHCAARVDVAGFWIPHDCPLLRPSGRCTWMSTPRSGACTASVPDSGRKITDGERSAYTWLLRTFASNGSVKSWLHYLSQNEAVATTRAKMRRL